MTDRQMMDQVETYQMIREVLRVMENGGFIYVGKQGEGFTVLNALLPDTVAERIKREVVTTLKGEMAILNCELQHTLNEDKAEMLGEEEEPVLIPQLDVVPKNDYRRHQNSQEDDDGK